MLVFGLVLGLLGLGGAIWCLIEAFTEDTTQGVLCLCVPFYSFYFTIAKVDPPKKWIILGLLICGLVGIIVRAVAS